MAVNRGKPSRKRVSDTTVGIAVGVVANYIYNWLTGIDSAAGWQWLPIIGVAGMNVLLLAGTRPMSMKARASGRHTGQMDRPVLAVVLGGLAGVVAAAVGLLSPNPWHWATVGGYQLWFLRAELPLAIALGSYGLWLAGGKTSHLVRVLAMVASASMAALTLNSKAPFEFHTVWSAANYLLIAGIGSAIGCSVRTEPWRGRIGRLVRRSIAKGTDGDPNPGTSGYGRHEAIDTADLASGKSRDDETRS